MDLLPSKPQKVSGITYHPMAVGVSPCELPSNPFTKAERSRRAPAPAMTQDKILFDLQHPQSLAVGIHHCALIGGDVLLRSSEVLVRSFEITVRAEGQFVIVNNEFLNAIKILVER